MREKAYILQGEPTSRARPGHRRVWDDQRTQKLVCGIELTNQHQGEPLFEHSVILEVTFILEIPLSWPVARRKSYDGRNHISKPGIGNLIRFLEDICTGVIYTEDCIVSKVVAQKLYGLEPRTQFTLKGIGNG